MRVRGVATNGGRRSRDACVATETETERSSVIYMTKKFATIVSILIVLILGELLWSQIYLAAGGSGALMRRLPQHLLPERFKPPVASLALSPETGRLKVGQKMRLEIVVQTSTAINGVDAVLTYDPEALQVEVFEGQSFDRTLRAAVIPEQSLITLTAVMEPGETIIGKQVVGYLEVTPRKTGSSEIRFDFTRGETRDSNVSSGLGRVQDLLDKVSGGRYDLVE